MTDHELAAKVLRDIRVTFRSEPTPEVAELLARAAGHAFKTGILGNHEYGMILGDVAEWLCRNRPAADNCPYRASRWSRCCSRWCRRRREQKLWPQLHECL